MRLAQLLLALSTAHAVVVTPIGPFCPFRSQACALGGNLDGDFQQLTAASPQFVMEMSRMQLDMQMGKEPDRGKMAELAKQLDASHRQWETLLAKMRLSPDFQSGEYFKMTSAHMEEQGQSLDELGLMVRWQCDSMAAFAEGKMPPMPPPGIDLMKLQQQAESGAGQQAAMSSMLSPPSVTAMPFDAALFESDARAFRDAERQRKGNASLDFDLERMARLTMVKDLRGAPVFLKDVRYRYACQSTTPAPLAFSTDYLCRQRYDSATMPPRRLRATPPSLPPPPPPKRAAASATASLASRAVLPSPARAATSDDASSTSSGDERERRPPYDASALGGDADAVGEIVRDCPDKWNEEVVRELLRWGAKPPLHERPTRWTELSTPPMIECTFVQPDGSASRPLWMPLAIIKFNYPSLLTHLEIMA